MNRDELREKLARELADLDAAMVGGTPVSAERWQATRGTWLRAADELMPHIDAHVQAELKAQREQIAADLESRTEPSGKPGDVEFRSGITRAASVVRAAGGDGDV